MSNPTSQEMKDAEDRVVEVLSKEKTYARHMWWLSKRCGPMAYWHDRDRQAVMNRLLAQGRIEIAWINSTGRVPRYRVKM